MTTSYGPDDATLLEIYRKVALLLANDERGHKVSRAGRLVMPYYSYRVLEFIPTGAMPTLADDDSLATICRGIHDTLAKDAPLSRRWGTRGQGRPMHLTCPKKGIMVTTGIVGSSLPIATGIVVGSAAVRQRSRGRRELCRRRIKCRGISRSAQSCCYLEAAGHLPSSEEVRGRSRPKVNKRCQGRRSVEEAWTGQ